MVQSKHLRSWVVGFVILLLLLPLCASIGTSAGELSVNVWTGKPQYQIGEAVTIYFSASKACTAKLTVIKPDGTGVVWGPTGIPAGTGSVASTAGYPTGQRQVVFEAQAGSEYKKAVTYFTVVDQQQGGQPGQPQPPQPPQPPAIPGAPESQQPGPGESPQSLIPVPFALPVPAGLYVYYMGSYTTVAQTNVGGSLAVYLNVPSAGQLWLFEYYWATGQWKGYTFVTSAGWKRLWFYGDVGGWHSTIANVNGSWTNWVQIYVGAGGTPPGGAPQYQGWSSCSWQAVGGQKSHNDLGDWCPAGSFLTQLDLDRYPGADAQDNPVVGRAKCCKLSGFEVSSWGTCSWQAVGGQKSHNDLGDWCPAGSFLTQLDLDRYPGADAQDNPVIGRAKCTRPSP
jgi:hypothetical protein